MNVAVEEIESDGGSEVEKIRLKPMIGERSWDSLPKHIIETICKYKVFRELKVLQLVCSKWFEDVNPLIGKEGVIALTDSKSKNLVFNYYSDITKFIIDSKENFQIILKSKLQIKNLKIATRSSEDLEFILANAGKALDYLLIFPKFNASAFPIKKLLHLNTVRLLHLDFSVNANDFKTILSTFNDIQEIKMVSLDSTETAGEILPYVDSLRHMAAIEGSNYFQFQDFQLKSFRWLNRETLHSIPQTLESLESLVIVDENILCEILAHLKNLTSIDFFYESFVINNSFLNFREIRITCAIEVLDHLFSESLTNLTILELRRTEVNDHALQLLSDNAPNLRQLLMPYCQLHITIPAINYMAQRLRNLEVLMIGNFQGINQRNKGCVVFPNLRLLKICENKTNYNPYVLRLTGDKVEIVHMTQNKFSDLRYYGLVAKNFANLRTLYLNSKKVNDEVVLYLCKKLKRLVHLEFLERGKMTKASIKTVVQNSNLSIARFNDFTWDIKNMDEVDQLIIDLDLKIGKYFIITVFLNFKIFLNFRKC